MGFLLVLKSPGCHKTVLLKKYNLGSLVESIKSWEKLIKRFISLDNLRSHMFRTSMHKPCFPSLPCSLSSPLPPSLPAYLPLSTPSFHFLLIFSGRKDSSHIEVLNPVNLTLTPLFHYLTMRQKHQLLNHEL